MRAVALSCQPRRWSSEGCRYPIVTPPLRIPFLTSSGLGTNAPFTGVHDDLHARALVLENGEHAVAVLAVDSIGRLGLGWFAVRS